MPRTVRDARLETRAARAKLPPRGDREPYWRAIGTGQHVGYYKGTEGGTWLARWRPPGGSYKKRKLGLADDVRDADGVRVLSYSQAQSRAREVFTELDRQHEGAEPVPTGPYRVRDAINGLSRVVRPAPEIGGHHYGRGRARTSCPRSATKRRRG